MPRLIKDPCRYKTVLCQNFQLHGECPYKHKCQFAHGVHELRLRAPTTTPPLKERANQLSRLLDLPGDTSIAAVIDAANVQFGLRERLGALATLPEKMELAYTVAAAARRAPPAPPPSPYPERTEAPLLGSSTAVAAPPPPPPSPLRPVPPSHSAEFKLQCHPAEDEEPFYINADTGKVEARGCSAPLPTREPSHATEMVRRAVSFILDFDEPTGDTGPLFGGGADIWSAPTLQPWAASKYGRQAAAGAA